MNQDVIRLEQVIRCLSPKIKIPIEKNKLLLAPKLREIRLRINERDEADDARIPGGGERRDLGSLERVP